MPNRLTPWSARQLYEFIKVHRDKFDVHQMCRTLGVARSGYYAWLKTPQSDRAREDARLVKLIRASHDASHGIYGSPRVFLDLREDGETCSKHRVARLMRVNKITAAHGYRRRSGPVPKPSVIAPDLVQRRFDVIRPNKVWATDITYIRTWQGWLYLAMVMDLYSRKIVGWTTGPTLKRELVLDAVLKAIRSRQLKGTIIHSAERRVSDRFPAQGTLNNAFT
jgi:putative transposase